MEFIGALLLGSFMILFFLGIIYFFVTQFKKWNEGRYYKENTSREFITSYFITTFVVLLMSYLAGELLWHLLTILIIIGFLKLLFEFHEFKTRSRK